MIFSAQSEATWSILPEKEMLGTNVTHTTKSRNNCNNAYCYHCLDPFETGSKTRKRCENSQGKPSDSMDVPLVVNTGWIRSKSNSHIEELVNYKSQEIKLRTYATLHAHQIPFRPSSPHVVRGER